MPPIDAGLYLNILYSRLSLSQFLIIRYYYSDGDKDAYCVCTHALWVGIHASFSVMCTMYTSKNDSTHQFCNVVHT